MGKFFPDHSTGLCPYLDRRDTRCSAMLTMKKLHEAFRLCAGDHECCSVYHQIRCDDLEIQSAPMRLSA
jgi:hypothetical protein